MKCCIFLTIFFCLKFSCAASAVKQDTNVHDIAKTVTRGLWAKLVTKQGRDLTFSADKDSKFSVSFALAVADINQIINRIENSQPILQFLTIKDMGPVFSMVLQDSDLDAAQISQDWDKSSVKNLRLAMKKMGALGKHENATDWDNEANVHANEVLVRVWSEVKGDNGLLQYFLTQLADAAPTCIQGHTVRLVEVVSSVVNNPKPKTIIEKKTESRSPKEEKNPPVEGGAADAVATAELTDTKQKKGDIRAGTDRTLSKQTEGGEKKLEDIVQEKKSEDRAEEESAGGIA